MIITRLPTKPFLMAFFLLTYSISSAYADVNLSAASATDMIRNIGAQIPNLTRLLTAIAYVLGMLFIVSGIIKLKHAGELRTMMSAEHNLMTPLLQIAVGALLLYLPTTVHVGLSTFWSSPCPYCYLNDQDQYSEFINIGYSIVQFVGVLALIRGLVILSHHGQSSQPGHYRSGFTHVIGGILCINISEFIKVIFYTLGIQT